MRKFKKVLGLLLLCTILAAVVGCDKEKDVVKETETVQEKESETVVETLPDMPQPTVEIPTASIPEEKTFANDEETYKYAVAKMNDGKYYLAIKYLRKIPKYKDSGDLQIKIMNMMKQDYLGYDDVAGKVTAIKKMNAAALSLDNIIKRNDVGLADTEVLQRLEYSYIDKSGNLKMAVAVDSVPKDTYENIFKPLLAHNKSVKYRKVIIDWYVLILDEGVQTLPYRVYMLTMDGKLMSYDINNKKIVPSQGVIAGEALVDINDTYALSVNGNIYGIDMDRQNGVCSLKYIKELSDVVALSSLGGAAANGLDEFCGFVGINSNGNIVADSTMSKRFPVIKSWSDIVSVERELEYEYYGYCCGLTSTGEILVAYEGGTTTLKPFDAGKKYVSIACDAEAIVAVTDSGEVCVETVPTWADKCSGTIEIPEYQMKAEASGTDKTFSSDAETYNYANTCFNEGKYTEAIKYLQKIPEYKETEKLMDKVYRYVNHEFIDFEKIRYTQADAMFYYTDKKVINNGNRQELDFGYIDSLGVYVYEGTQLISDDFYNRHFKILVEYNQKVKFKQITTTGEKSRAQFNWNYILTEDGSIVHIDAKDGVGVFKLEQIDMSVLPEGEKIVYISSNAALSNKGYVYYVKDLKLVKDDTMSDIAAIKSGCGVLMAVNTDGRIVLSQPQGWKIPLSLSTLENVVAIDMGLKNEGDAGYFFALKADGTVIATRRAGSQIMLELPKDKKFVSIAFNQRIGDGRLVALTAEGEIYVFKVE
ncbi:MAG: hypothetical protein IJB96_11185 [Lachnospira sp.]|nr:hypothetical protein [Lachnospira sp.]